MMTPLRKAVMIGLAVSIVAFAAAYVPQNWDLWQAERDGWIIDTYGDNGWLFSCSVAVIAYIATFTPLLYVFNRQVNKSN